MKPKFFLLSALASSFIGIYLAGHHVAASQPPGILNHQGRITSEGVNYEGVGYFKFALVDENGWKTYWSNDGTSVAGGEPGLSVPVVISKGRYTVPLGDTGLYPGMAKSIPSDVFASHSHVRLRIWFSADNVDFERLSPDQRILSVGYALNAGSVRDIDLDALVSDKYAQTSIKGSSIISTMLTEAKTSLTGIQIGTLLLGDSVATPEVLEGLSRRFGVIGYGGMATGVYNEGKAFGDLHAINDGADWIEEAGSAPDSYTYTPTSTYVVFNSGDSVIFWDAYLGGGDSSTGWYWNKCTVTYVEEAGAGTVLVQWHDGQDWETIDTIDADNGGGGEGAVSISYNGNSWNSSTLPVKSRLRIVHESGGPFTLLALRSEIEYDEQTRAVSGIVRMRAHFGGTNDQGQIDGIPATYIRALAKGLQPDILFVQQKGDPYESWANLLREWDSVLSKSFEPVYISAVPYANPETEADQQARDSQYGKGFVDEFNGQWVDVDPYFGTWEQSDEKGLVSGGVHASSSGNRLIGQVVSSQLVPDEIDISFASGDSQTQEELAYSRYGDISIKGSDGVKLTLLSTGGGNQGFKSQWASTNKGWYSEMQMISPDNAQWPWGISFRTRLHPAMSVLSQGVRIGHIGSDGNFSTSLGRAPLAQLEVIGKSVSQNNPIMVLGNPDGGRPLGSSYLVVKDNFHNGGGQLGGSDTIFLIDHERKAYFGYGGFGPDFHRGDEALHIRPHAADQLGLVVQGQYGQTDDLFQLQEHEGGLLVGVGGAGAIQAPNADYENEDSLLNAGAMDRRYAGFAGDGVLSGWLADGTPSGTPAIDLVDRELEGGEWGVPDGVRIGGGATVRGVATTVATLDFPLIAAGGEVAMTVALAGVSSAGVPSVELGWSAALASGVVVKQAWVSADDTVRIILHNATSASVDPPPLDCRVKVTSF